MERSGGLSVKVLLLLPAFLAVFLVIEGLFLAFRYGNINLPQFPGVNLSESYTPGDLQYRPPAISSSGSITYYLSLSRMEKVEQKSLFLERYVVLTLRPKIGSDKFSRYTYNIALPANLVSRGERSLYPGQLAASVGQGVSLWLTFDRGRNSYRFFNVSSWEIKDISP